MAINLPSLVSQLMTPALVERAGAAIGIDPALARKLAAAAIPSVLGAFASEASSPGGAKAISELISSQEPGLFDRLAAGVTGGDAGALAPGTGRLAALLGEEGSSQLAGVLAQAAGAPQPAAAAILGLAGAAAVEALGSQPPEAWADGPAIAALLAGERQAIAAALPASLAAVLADGGFLRGFQTAVNGAFRTTPPRSTLGPVTPAAQPGPSTLGSAAGGPAPGRSTLDVKPAPGPEVKHAPAPPPPRPSSGTATWLYLVLALLIVGGLAWYLFHERRPTPAPGGTGRIEAPASPGVAA